jgi:hypothetical protein
MEAILVASCGYNPVAVYYVNVVDVCISGSNHNSISINVHNNNQTLNLLPKGERE